MNLPLKPSSLCLRSKLRALFYSLSYLKNCCYGACFFLLFQENTQASPPEEQPLSSEEPAIRTSTHLIQTEPIHSNSHSIFLAARLGHSLQHQAHSFCPHPERIQLSCRATKGIGNLQWEVTIRLQPAPSTSESQELQWTIHGEDYAQIPQLVLRLREQIAAAYGIDFTAIEDPPLPSIAELLSSLHTPLPSSLPVEQQQQWQKQQLAQLIQLCIETPENLDTLFTPTDDLLHPYEENPLFTLPSCHWLELNTFLLQQQNSSELQLLLEDFLLLPAIDRQLVNNTPSLALFCWGSTQHLRLDSSLSLLEKTSQRSQLAQFLHRKLDPEFQPHWANLRSQLRLGLLLANRTTQLNSAFNQALQEELRDSNDGDDLLLQHVLPLQHLEEIPATKRQQAVDAVWQGRALWNRYPAMRNFLHALTIEVCRGTTPLSAAELPTNLAEDTIAVEHLLPALLIPQTSNIDSPD